jgi:hypothetical protein
MWWVWAIVALVALLGTVFVLTRGRPAPDDRVLRERHSDDPGHVSPGESRPGRQRSS